MLKDLFETYMTNISKMPQQFSAAAKSQGESGRARIVADYVAGMTDRFAIAEHERIMG